MKTQYTSRMSNAASEAARALQRLSVVSRWGRKTEKQKHAEMSALAKARWAKAKRKPKRAEARANDPSSATTPSKP